MVSDRDQRVVTVTVSSSYSDRGDSSKLNTVTCVNHSPGSGLSSSLSLESLKALKGRLTETVTVTERVTSESDSETVDSDRENDHELVTVSVIESDHSSKSIV